MKIVVSIFIFFTLAYAAPDKLNHSFAQYEEYLKHKKKITMCVDPNWMPYEKIEKGQHIGMASDFIQIFQERIGIPIELVPTKTWEESMIFAQKRKCDIFSLAMSTPSRLEYMNFTKPYISFPIVIATKLDTLFILDVRDIIPKKTLGIVRGYAFSEILKRQYPNHKIVDVENINDGLNKVANGEIFGFIGTLATIGYELQTNYIGTLKIAGKFNENWELGIGVRNDDEVLFVIFEKLIDSLNTEDKQEVFNKWLSVKFDEKVNYELVIQVSIVLIIIIASHLQIQIQASS